MTPLSKILAAAMLWTLAPILAVLAASTPVKVQDNQAEAIETLGGSPSQEEPDEPALPFPRRSALPSDAERIAALEIQVTILTRALNDARRQIAHLEKSVPPNPIPPLTTIAPDSILGPDQVGPDPMLQSLIRQLLQESVDPKRAENITQEMIEWAQDDRDRRRDLLGFARRALDAQIGNEAANDAIRKMLMELMKDEKPETKEDP